jgi:flavodoxin
MTEEELKSKMLSFIAQQDNTYNDEWYCTAHQMYSGIMRQFAAHAGFELFVPPKEAEPPKVGRAEMLQELLPEIQKMFGTEYAKYTKEQP